MLIVYSGSNYVVFWAYALKFNDNYLIFSQGVHYAGSSD